MEFSVQVLIPVALVLLLVGGLFFTLIGLFTFWHILRPQKSPADTSNRINKIRLWWFALTREDKFVGVFPWLKNDEYDNVTPNAQSNPHAVTAEQVGIGR